MTDRGRTVNGIAAGRRNHGLLRDAAATNRLAVRSAGGAGWRVSDTMEIARRWSGYVCPDCRFVFRVPRDHDGKGIVCPSCRRLLKIPAAADQTLPLMAPLRRLTVEETAGDGEPKTLKKRRRGRKTSSSGDHAWEHLSKTPRGGDRGKMRLMLFGGAVLFSLIVAGVVFFLNHGENSRSAVVAAAPVVAVAKSAELSVVERSEASLLAEAEPLTRKFLEATSVDELLPLVREPAVAELRMRAFYPDGKIAAPGLSQFNPTGTPASRGEWFSIAVRTRDQEEKSIAFMKTPEGMKIDWESWVGWSAVSWEEFRSSKPVIPQVFRVSVSTVDYYNFGFSDDTKWRSYRLTSTDREHSLYGYLERGSMLEQRLQPETNASEVAMMLSLKFPAGATADSQVMIEGIVADGWVEGDTP